MRWCASVVGGAASADYNGMHSAMASVAFHLDFTSKLKNTRESTNSASHIYIYIYMQVNSYFHIQLKVGSTTLFVKAPFLLGSTNEI